VRCNACQHENREGRKFCASCGSALAILCHECGFANEAGERFCGGCGRPLATADAVASESKPVAEPEGDRRPVTVLFCDLVGYTRLSSMLDPEDVHALLQRFFALVDASVDRFGGTIDKHIGDAVMALFGAPLARGNDAERAVRAALEIQASVPALASGLPSPLAVHIGIATGEVIASSVGSQHHRGYTVTGEAANVAARLLDRASGGETFVSDAVYRATSHIVSYEAVGSLTLKGVEHAVEAWRPTELRNTGRDTSALVGRRSELGQLRAVLDACINGSSGAAVLIRGEAGIGKTRLMDELQSIAGGSGMTCTAGYVLDFGTARGHGAVRTVVAGLLGLGSGATIEAAESAIERLRQTSQMQPDDALYLRDLLEIPHSEETRTLYAAMDSAARTHGKERVVTALVRSTADQQPLLVAVEDVHWADPDTLSLLAAVTRATSLSRTVLIMTTRLEGDKLDAQWRSMAGGATVITIDLAPLSAEDAMAIARRFIDVSAFADQCVERAGGNPLFLEQLLRGAGDLTDGRLPASIQSVVLARTDLLSASDRRAIQAASALGQRFNLVQLRTLLGDARFVCETLVQNALLRPTGEGFLFAHALVREGVYGSLTNSRKRELHAAAAAIFADDPVLRAEHLDRAGAAEAARAYFAAATMQANLFRHDQAIALATRGLALARGGRDAFDLAILLGDLQQKAGRGTEALEAYRRALSESTDDADRCRSLIGCAASNRLTSRIDDAFSALAGAEPLASSRGDDRGLAEIHYIRGNLHFARGKLPECRGEHELALEAARRVSSPEWQARALSGLADAQYMDCRMATALRHFTDCVELCEAHGLTRIALPNRTMMGICRGYVCDFDRGLDDVRAAVEVALRIGDQHAEMFAKHVIGSILSGAGRYLEAEKGQPEALQLARKLKSRRFEAAILGNCAEIALGRGLKAEALAFARTGLDISEETGHGFVGPGIFALLALVEDRREDQEAALAAGEALLEQGSVGHNQFWFRRYAIERALLLEDWNQAERHADALLARMANEPLVFSSWVAQRGKILARFGRSEATDADEGELKRILEAAADADFRIGAISESLRRI
jgi:class 3 adenylate cyclase/tetratricopeptide (TPR) repeat protein/ABC-type transport system involved in cytochrome c biogenesis ATPase subunit